MNIDDRAVSQIIAPYIGYTESPLTYWNSPLAPDVRFFWQTAYLHLTHRSTVRTAVERHYGPSMLHYLI